MFSHNNFYITYQNSYYHFHGFRWYRIITISYPRTGLTQIGGVRHSIVFCGLTLTMRNLSLLYISINPGFWVTYPLLKSWSLCHQNSVMVSESPLPLLKSWSLCHQIYMCMRNYFNLLRNAFIFILYSPHWVTFVFWMVHVSPIGVN